MMFRLEINYQVMYIFRTSIGSFSKQEKWKKWKRIAKIIIRMLFGCSYLFYFLPHKKVEAGFHLFLALEK